MKMPGKKSAVALVVSAGMLLGYAAPIAHASVDQYVVIQPVKDWDAKTLQLVKDSDLMYRNTYLIRVNGLRYNVQDFKDKLKILGEWKAANSPKYNAAFEKMVVDALAESERLFAYAQKEFNNYYRAPLQSKYEVYIVNNNPQVRQTKAQIQAYYAYEQQFIDYDIVSYEVQNKWYEMNPTAPDYKEWVVNTKDWTKDEVKTMLENKKSTIIFLEENYKRLSNLTPLFKKIEDQLATIKLSDAQFYNITLDELTQIKALQAAQLTK
ncbi:MAG: hypothetical protein ACRC5C_03310, partial [Bacilli bacterium]